MRRRKIGRGNSDCFKLGSLAAEFFIENHSMIKAFIKNFQVKLPQDKKVIQFLNDGFTKQPFPKVVIEPGQAYSINVIKSNFESGPDNPSEYGDFVVTTDIGYKFSIPAKTFQKYYMDLMNID